MTLIEQDLVSGSLYSIQQTKDRGRAVYAARDIPETTTVHVAQQPFVSVIKEKFKKEVCAWCFKYEYGKNCAVKHRNPLSGVSFCSEECLDEWNGFDYDGKVVEAWASLRTSKARKVGFILSDADILANFRTGRLSFRSSEIGRCGCGPTES
jgi:hypothetical protein